MTRILAVLAMLAASNSISSQTTLNFCTAVEKEYCFFNNTQFIAPPDSSRALIYLYVKNQRGFNTPVLYFKAYKIDKSTGKESLIFTLEQVVESNWEWAWKSELFGVPGNYRVRISNHANQTLADKSFEIFKFPKK